MINKSIETSYGSNATYHIISSYSVDTKTGNITVTVSSYVDEAAYLANKQSIMTQSFTFPAITGIDTATILTAIENAVKLTQTFAEV